jgi:hypothetical protein
MWVLVSFEDRLFSVDPIDLGPREALDGIANGGSDVGPGSNIGAGSIWVTASTTVTRISLGI